MTTEKIWPCDDEESKRFPLFTRANTGEVFVDAATPLTWSLYGRGVYENGYRDALYKIGVFVPEDFRPEGEGEVVGCFGGYVYINVSLSRVLAVRTPGMTSEAIDQAFFGAHPNVPPHRPNPKDENPACSERMVAWMTSLFSATSVPGIDVVRKRLDEIAKERPDLTKLSNEQLLARFRSLVPEMRKSFAQHMLGTYSANIVSGAVAQIGSAVGLGHLVPKVTAGFGDVDSAKQSFEIWELSRIAKRSKAVKAEFDKGVDGLLGRLEKSDDADAKAFLKGWSTFLSNWGFLGPSVWELRSPTYAANPEIPLRMIDRARTVPDSDSPKNRSASLAREREEAAAQIAAKIEDPATRGQFEAAVAVLPVHMPAREAIKVQSTRFCEEARMNMRELGGRFVKDGTLPRWEDILLLMDNEIDDFLTEPKKFKKTIDERREKLKLLESLWPPFIFEGPPPTIDQFKPRSADTLQPAKKGEVLSGLGASPGTHTGIARIVKSLYDDVELNAGDILVATATDSSWGPLFLTAGAVVTETGAIISHAAIVSRELGIPSAVSVEKATTRIPDGARVTVNGNDGTVTVH